MHSLKCPIPDCDSATFQIVQHNGVNLLVCESGHVMSRDYSVELAKFSQEISSAVDGLSAAIKAQTEAISNNLTNVANALAKKD